MCITRFVNNILFNFLKIEYSNSSPTLDLYIIKIDPINSIKKSFSQLTNNNNKNSQLTNNNKISIIKKQQRFNTNLKLHTQTLSHNLTYDHGISLLN